MSLVEKMGDIFTDLKPNENYPYDKKTINFLNETRQALTFPLQALKNSNNTLFNLEAPLLVNLNKAEPLKPIDNEEEDFTTHFQLLDYYERSDDTTSALQQFDIIRNHICINIEKNGLDDSSLRAFFQLITYSNRYINESNRRDVQAMLNTMANLLIENRQAEPLVQYNHLALLNKVLPFIFKYCDKDIKEQFLTTISSHLGMTFSWQAKHLSSLPFTASKSKELFKRLQILIDAFEDTRKKETLSYAKGNGTRLNFHINLAIQRALRIDRSDFQAAEDLAEFKNFLKILIQCQQENKLEALSLKPLANGALNEIKQQLLVDAAHDIHLSLTKLRLEIRREQGNKVKENKSKRYFHEKLQIENTDKYFLKKNFQIPLVKPRAKHKQYFSHAFYLSNKFCWALSKRYQKALVSPKATLEDQEEARQLLDHFYQYQSLANFDLKTVKNLKLQKLVRNYQNERYAEATLFALWNRILICNDKVAREELENALMAALKIDSTRLKSFARLWKSKSAVAQSLIQKEFEHRGYTLPTTNFETGLVNHTREVLLAYYTNQIQPLENKLRENKLLEDKLLENNPLKNKLRENNLREIAHYNHLVDQWNEMLYCLCLDKNFKGLTQKITDPYLAGVIEHFNQAKQRDKEEHYTQLRNAFHRYIDKPTLDSDNKQAKFIIHFLTAIGGTLYAKNIIYRFFPNDGKACNNHAEQLEALHHFLVKKLMQVQAADFGDKIKEDKKFVFINYYKKRFNRFGQSINSAMTVTHVPDYIKLLYSCESLFNLLEKNVSHHPLIERYRKRVYRNLKGPFPSTDPDEFKEIFKDPALFKEWKQKRLYLKDRKNDLPELLLLQKELAVALKKENISKPANPFIFTLDDSVTIKKEKQNLRWKKKLARNVGNFFAWTLAFGQAALGFYAISQLIPFFGTAAAIFTAPVFAIAGFAFFATLWSNFVLFKSSVYLTLRQFLINYDWFNGFTTPSGKILMGVALGGALTIACTLGVMVGISASAALGAMSFFPPVPAAIIIGFLGITTAIGFACLMYRTLANNINKACIRLENTFPEIAKNGWGITGIAKGIKQGMQRYWHSIQTPGAYSPRGGLWNAIKEKWRREWNEFWVNPTGNCNDTREKVIEQRTKNIVHFIINPIFIVLGLLCFGFATFGMVKSMYVETFNFLTLSSKNPFFTISPLAANIITWILVCGVAGFVRLVFNLANTSKFFEFLGEKTTNGISAVFTEIRHCFCTEKHFKERVESMGSAIKTGAVAVFRFVFDSQYREVKLAQWRDDPRHKQKIKDWFNEVFRDNLSIIVNGLASGALVLKGDLTAHQAETFNDLTTGAEIRGIATTNTSVGSNYIAFADLAGAKPIKHIPLQEIRKEKKLKAKTTHTQVFTQTGGAPAPNQKELTCFGNDDYSPAHSDLTDSTESYAPTTSLGSSLTTELTRSSSSDSSRSLFTSTC